MKLYPDVGALSTYTYHQNQERVDFATAALQQIQAIENRWLALQTGLRQIVWLAGAKQGLLSTCTGREGDLQPLLACDTRLTEAGEWVETEVSAVAGHEWASQIPLKSFGKIVGTVYLDQIKYVKPLAEQRQSAVEILINYLALLVENLELSQIAQDKQTLLEMFTTTGQIGQRLNANPEATQALAEFLESGRFLFDAERCFIMVANWETGMLRLLDNHIPNVASKNLPEVNIEDTPVGWVAYTGEPLLIPELHMDGQRSQTFEKTLGFKARQLLCVPLRVRGDVLGVIAVVNKIRGHFDELDLNLLQMLAPSAAIVVENAHRFAWQQAEAEQKTELYSVASHALRSPMMNILASVEWILEIGVRNKLQRTRLEDIRSQIFNLAKLAGAILDMTRIDQENLPIQLTPVALMPLVKKTLVAFEQRFPTYHFDLDVTESIPPVHADETQLAIILDHLVENAVKYSPADSTVRIELVTSAAQVLISVRDQGSGIFPDELSNIFNRYYRGRHQPAKGHSLGLGLYIARKLVQAQGGDIWVNSATGRGSCFTFTLLQAELGDLL